ncbi:MAG: hypothetical protein HYV62_07000 [Candidatus Rokubacteria bacterium]|nr:hypothetical protein [Candidatus Rokubacteria bacterium]
MDYVGIDLQKKESQICILSEGGQLSECRIRTEPRRFAEVLGGRPRARILLEAATESEWVARLTDEKRIMRVSPDAAPPIDQGAGQVKGWAADVGARAAAAV